MKPFMILFAVLCCLAVGLAGAESKDCLCGDANCDGVTDAYDGIYIFNYICGGGPAPLTADLDHADWDGHQDLTIADFWLANRGNASPHCPPTYGSIVPLIYDVDTLFYTNRMRAGASAKLMLNFRVVDLTDVLAYQFPLQIRVDGQIPTVDSVVLPLAIEHPSLPIYSAVYTDSGCIALGSWALGVILSVENIAGVYLSVPSSPSGRPITVEWVNLTPVQAPAPDSSVIPMLLKNEYEKMQAYSFRIPILAPTCCITAGDVNDDGKVNVGDAVYLITHVFQFGPPPPCRAQADPNNDGTVNIGDAVFLINYIFRGGPAPTCR
jgi:hypothetical protein